jgi:two-component SAPR family response regulator
MINFYICISCDGYDFINKTQEIVKQAKVVFMSSFDIEDKEFHDVISDIKVDALLQKPFTLRELRDTLQKNSVTVAMR